MELEAMRMTRVQSWELEQDRELGRHPKLWESNRVIDIIKSEFYSISHIAVVILRGEDIDRDSYWKRILFLTEMSNW